MYKENVRRWFGSIMAVIDKVVELLKREFRIKRSDPSSDYREIT